MSGVDRLFVGVALSDDTRAALASQLAEHSPLPGRPGPPQNWHITLRFLGPSTPTQRDRLTRQLDSTDLGSSFSMTLRGLGAFPRARAATVLWVAVARGITGLAQLAAFAEDAAGAAGFAAEHRPFHPHVTLSRLRPQQDLTPLLEVGASVGATQTVDMISLIRSHLGDGRARYEVIESFPLG